MFNYISYVKYDVAKRKTLSIREDQEEWIHKMDRDANAALNILSRGFKKLGLGQSEDITPVETALPMFTSSGATDVVDVKRVVETGSPCLMEPPTAASRQG